MSDRAMIFTLAGLMCVLAFVFALLLDSWLWSSSPEEPIGTGWGDPCFVVPDGVPFPLEWRFTHGPDVVASGRCTG